MKISKPTRLFVPKNLSITSWNDLDPIYQDLLDREINDFESFKKWIQDQSELEAVLEEDMAWRYIRMTIDTRDEELSNKYTTFVTEIQPKIAPIDDQLNRKLIDSPFLNKLEEDQSFAILIRRIKESLELYREENIQIQSEISTESQKYGSLSAAQSIEHNGERLTMQKAAILLKEQDEKLRKEVFTKIANRRREDVSSFDELFDTLIAKRHQVAVNAGFKNFRDYKMVAMGRFDYSVEDCYNFHNAIKKIIVPIVKDLQLETLSKLGKEKFSPWDTDVDPEGKAPLKPFTTGEELLDGTINMFNRIDPYFGDCIQTMAKMNHLDLESKEGKSPGGYNYPLYEIGVPFIFMNAVGSQRDLVTMVHEGGHAVHSFLSRDLPITGFKNLPSEVAELASMSMELISMTEWNEFYKNDDDLNRAKKDQLESVLKILPWIAQVDEFQHWIYENPNHSHTERSDFWLKLSSEYGTGLTDWTGFEDIKTNAWQRQLHIFEVPFYYIEYGIAQLGALGIWKNYLTDKASAISHYKNALKLAYTKSIPEIYEVANIKFDFTEAYINDLVIFIKEQLSELN
jgi:oligoendopeptidase F